MADPIIQDGGVLGIKVGTIVAGFAGGVISLSFVKELTPRHAALAVVIGVIAAAFVTPLLMYYLGVPDKLQNGVAFLLGLTAMNVIPAVLRFSEIVKNDPSALFARFLRKESDDGA